MKKERTGLHKVALAALFTVGNALLRYPWRQSDSGVLMLFLLSAAGALIPAFLLYPLFRKIWRAPLSKHGGRRFLVGVLSIAFGAYALYCAWRGWGDYLDFSMKLVLPHGSRFLLTVAFLGCAAWMATLTDRGMDSFSLVAFLGVLACVLFLFCAGIPHFRWDGAEEWIRWDPSALQSLPALWGESLLPLTVLSVYFALTVPKGGERSLALGTGVGCILLFLCVMQALLTFGASYAAELAYPYSYSVRILSVGQYFFRLEGFSYLLDYLSCLWRCAVSLAVTRRLLGRFFPRLGRYAPLCGAGLIFAIFIIR